MKDGRGSMRREGVGGERDGREGVMDQALCCTCHGKLCTDVHFFIQGTESVH